MQRDTDMIIEQRAWERDTSRAIGAAVDQVVGSHADREIDAYMFDGSALILHDGHGAPAPEAEYAIARSLRGGRDFDPSRPCDWHVVARETVTRPGLQGDDRTIGTRIVLNSSLRAPEGYMEPLA
jgi:hypothetical protein